MQDLLTFLRSAAASWIQRQRDRFHPYAMPIDPVTQGALLTLVSGLDQVRWIKVPEIDNPDFYPTLATLGLTELIDFRMMDGITYADTIVVVDRLRSAKELESLLFHELVHVVQYRVLGVGEFAKQYVDGWANNGFEYRRIPLEVDAYALQERFDGGDRTFSVDAEVRAQLGMQDLPQA